MDFNRWSSDTHRIGVVSVVLCRWRFQGARAVTSDDEKLDRREPLVWVSPTDRAGRPVDARFLEAVRLIGGDLLRYRSGEFDDVSAAAELIEVAVHRCSRVAQVKGVTNPTAYLTRTYRRLVDVEIAKRRKHVELTAASESLERYDFESVMHDRIHVKKLLDSMDDEIRKLYLRRLVGFSVDEIARERNLSAKRLSERMRRGLRKALDRAFGTQTNKGE
jgi:DNA-directed RNA polymerase specialized sigma24 family protein